jgi:hypothetical protein
VSEDDLQISKTAEPPREGSDPGKKISEAAPKTAGPANNIVYKKIERLSVTG